MRIFLLFFIFLLFGCKKEHKVPVVIGLDSRYSSIAKELKNGMLICKKENLKFEFLDNKGDKYITKEIDSKLINKTPIVIGHITSDVSKYAVPLFNNTNTILFSPTTSTQELSGLDDNFIRIQSVKNFKNIEDLLKELQIFSIKKINIVYDESNKVYAQSIINAFLDKRNKYVKVNKIIPIDELNLKIEQIDLHTPIYIIGSTNLSVDMVIALKQKGFDSFIFVAGSAFTKDFIKLSGEYGEGVMFFSTFNPDSDNKNYLKFKKKFISKFGYSPGNFETKGYEIAKITSEVIDKPNIKKALINHTFEGLQGKIYIDKYGDTIRETHIYIINNSIFEKVK